MPNTEQHLWLIIPPCADRDDWVVAIKRQAANADFTVVDSPAPANASAAGRTLILSQDANEPHRANARPKNVAVVLSGSGPLPNKIDENDAPTTRHAAVKKASELTRRARALFSERVFTAKDVEASPVEIFSGFRLLGPKEVPVSHRNLALNGAFSIYANKRSSWRSEIFDINAKELRHNNGQVEFDLTGRPRVLMFGPYIVIPAGRWRATVRFGFSAPTAKHLYRADWGSQEVYTSYEFRPGREGLFQLVIEHEWYEPLPSEFRLLLLEGAFEGNVTFFGADIAQID